MRDPARQSNQKRRAEEEKMEAERFLTQRTKRNAESVDDRNANYIEGKKDIRQKN